MAIDQVWALFLFASDHTLNHYIHCTTTATITISTNGHVHAPYLVCKWPSNFLIKWFYDTQALSASISSTDVQVCELVLFASDYTLTHCTTIATSTDGHVHCTHTPSCASDLPLCQSKITSFLPYGILWQDPFYGHMLKSQVLGAQMCRRVCAHPIRKCDLASACQ